VYLVAQEEKTLDIFMFRNSRKKKYSIKSEVGKNVSFISKKSISFFLLISWSNMAFRIMRHLFTEVSRMWEDDSFMAFLSGFKEGNEE
jgi:hypothetical protein